MSDTQLTEHFSLEELTVTSNTALQAANRVLSGVQVDELRRTAEDVCEPVREICGGAPVRIHSGYRSQALNGATRGASGTSQHPKCEAVDLDVPGQTVDQSFALILAAARAGKFQFGQLILEAADRGYRSADGTESIARWVHVSRVGTLAPEHVGQVMEANWDEAEGKFDYKLIDRLAWPNPAS